MENNITIKDRSSLNITGVEHIYSFNDCKIELKTNKGDLTVMGSGLDLDKINIEEGIINIAGEINSLSYSRTKNKQESFLKKMFK